MTVIRSTPLTLAEFSKLPRNGERHEMSAGQLITMPPPNSLHSRIERKLFKALEALFERSNTTEAFTEAGYILSRDPLTVRQPDVSVLSKQRVQSTAADEYFEGPPDLAVKIVSPWDSAQGVQLQVDQYLNAGAKQVWVLYPKSKRVHVFHSGGATARLEEAQMLTGGDLLPPFSVKVGDLFLSENRASA